MFGFISKLFGNKQARGRAENPSPCGQIDAYSENTRASRTELRAKTAEFKQRYQDGESLDDLLPKTFATIKDACRRHVGQKWMAAEESNKAMSSSTCSWPGPPCFIGENRRNGHR